MLSAFLGRRPPKASPGEVEPKSAAGAAGGAPPLTSEEQNGNLSEIEKDLNRRMVCPAGKNQVFILSTVSGRGKSPPRIALRCSYRKELGQGADVYLEHIRTVCACDPNQCSAYREVRKRLADL